MREATYNALGMCSPHPGPLSPDSQAEAWLSGSTEIDAYHGSLLACCDSHLDIYSLQSTPVPHCNPLCLFSSAPPRGSALRLLATPQLSVAAGRVDPACRLSLHWSYSTGCLPQDCVGGTQPVTAGEYGLGGTEVPASFVPDVLHSDGLFFLGSPKLLAPHPHTYSLRVTKSLPGPPGNRGVRWGKEERTNGPLSLRLSLEAPFPAPPTTRPPTNLSASPGLP